MEDTKKKVTKKPVVKLVGTDGNAYALIGECVKAARTAGWSADRIKEFRDKAMSGNYDNLLVTCIDYFDVR